MNDDFNWLPYDEETRQEAAPPRRRRRVFLRFLPGFLRRSRAEPTEATAADMALQQGQSPAEALSQGPSEGPSEASFESPSESPFEKPIEELDQRLQALRERAQPGPQTDASSPRAALYDVDDLLARPEIIHRPGGLISPLALSKAQQEQVELLRDMVGGSAPQDEETNFSRGRGGFFSRGERVFSLRAIPNMLVSLFLLLVLALPFASAGFTSINDGDLPPPDFPDDRRGAQAAFALLDSLTGADYALVAFEYGPTAAGELDELADVMLRHIFAQGTKPIIVSSNPIAVAHARNVIAAIERSVAPLGSTLEENRDYFILRFLSGGALGLRDLSGNFGSIASTSARGQPTGLALPSLDSMKLIALIAERAENLRHWAEQVATETDSAFIAAVGYAAQPLAQPYVDAHDDIVGMFVGLRDAYTYMQKLQANYANFDLQPRRVQADAKIEIAPDDEQAAPTFTPLAVLNQATALSAATATSPPVPTVQPTVQPTITPTAIPTEPPTATPQPTLEPTATNTPLPRVEVIAAGLINIRRQPNTTSDILAVASAGDTFPVLGESDDGAWINILLPGNLQAWVATFLVEPVLPGADEQLKASDPARSEQVLLRLGFSLRLGNDPPRMYQANPPPQTDRAEFVLLREDRQAEQRLDAMTLGTIAAVLVIVAGNLFYALRALSRRGRADAES